MSLFSDSGFISFLISEDGVEIALFKDVSDVELPNEDDLDLETFKGEASPETRFCKGKCSPLGLLAIFLSEESFSDNLQQEE